MSLLNILLQILWRFGLFSIGMLLACAIVVPQNLIYPWRASTHYGFYTKNTVSNMGILVALLYVYGAFKGACTGKVLGLFTATLAGTMFILLPVGDICCHSIFGMKRHTRPKVSIGKLGSKIPRVRSEGNFRARVLKNN